MLQRQEASQPHFLTLGIQRNVFPARTRKQSLAPLVMLRISIRLCSTLYSHLGSSISENASMSCSSKVVTPISMEW